MGIATVRTFDVCKPFIKFHEGGEVDSAIDSGKHTIFGISSRTWKKDGKYAWFWLNPTWRGAEYIFRIEYFNANSLSNVPPHLAVICLDMFVTHNPSDATKAIQRGAEGLKIDGKFGPKTRRRLRDGNISASRILQFRMTLFKDIIKRRPKDEGNYDGWAWRTQCLNRYSLGIEAGISVHPNGKLIKQG